MSELSGKVAVVTGAAQGIGEAYATRLAHMGATVAVLDIDGEGAARVASELVAGGYAAVSGVCDISSHEAVQGAIDEVALAFGGIDVLINNAAIYRGLQKAVVDDIDVDYWIRMMNVNINGTFFVTRAVVPHMRTRGWGRIVNQGSIGAYLGREGSLHYSVSKAAVHAMVRVLAKELGSLGITVNAIAPGPVASPATLERMSPEHVKEYADSSAIKRMSTPEDMANIIGFLCSTRSDVVTGQTIVADGGIYFLG